MKEQIRKTRFERRQAPGRGASVAGEDQTGRRLGSSERSNDVVDNHYNDFERMTPATEIAQLSDLQTEALRNFFLLLDRYDRQNAAHLQRAA